jgi:hypothetical protein
MKVIIILASLFFSLNVFACPNLTGSFTDSDNESIRTISQKGCLSTTWVDEDGSTTLIADNVERVLESEGDMTAFAKVSFTKNDFIIDIRMDYGGHNDYDLPGRWLTSYRIDKFNNLVEKIQPFKVDGTELDTEYITYRRVK